MFAGFTSTILKLWLLISKFQRFIRKSSADIKVSPSLENMKEERLRGEMSTYGLNEKQLLCIIYPLNKIHDYMQIFDWSRIR